MDDLGTLSPVSVRKVWNNEASDFTPWLAENADRLGEALDLKLEHVKTEAQVGDYRADLVFREKDRGRLVVVENMLEPTNHDHLGKLITYAAGLGARYAVLIAPEYRAEHLSALNWLNSASTDDFAFFGVVLETWRIDDSKPAPRLRVDVKPDRWRRRVAADRRAAEASELLLAYREFWSEFLPEFKDTWPSQNRQPVAESSMHFFHSGLKFRAAFSGGTLRAERYSTAGETQANQEWFDRLYSRKDEIQEVVGGPLDLKWNPRPERDGFTVSLVYPEPINVRSQDDRRAAKKWLIDAMKRMREAFTGELGTKD